MAIVITGCDETPSDETRSDQVRNFRNQLSPESRALIEERKYYRPFGPNFKIENLNIKVPQPPADEEFIERSE